ncbi:ABC transporter substrate-binding protein [Streptomyces mexicanus]|uniref:ABC transporter substrate-binding protein n=1 Tax=Streptomyces mexicanus TaxID=178566 RepID=A0A7X1LR43_9ACTN|nr:ABC transporter substrate-binding protein [Streptomyces mexicanus]MBC2865016.1 ABC transporter substrate-binding protein [Streptomyces mexicanus]
MKRTLAMVAVGATVATLTLTGCGSGGGQSGGGPVKIFQFAPYESQTASLPYMKTSAQAAVDEVNAAGGINGRKLELETCDEKYDPNEAVRCAQRAVQEHAVAVVGSLSAFGAQVMPVLQSAKIPSIGADALTPADARSPMNYLIDSGVPGYTAMPAVAKKYLGATKIALIQIEFANAGETKKYVEKGAELSGSKIVYSAEIPTDTVDFSQYVAAAKKSGAQAIVSSLAAEWTTKLWKAMESTGSNLKVVASAGSVTPKVAAEGGDAAAGTYVVAGTPSADEANPWGKQYIAAMKKYEPSEKVYAGVGLRSYAAVHLFAEVAKGIDGGVTSTSLVQALDKVHDMEFMWIDHLSFDKSGPIAGYPRVVATEAFPAVIQDGKLVSKEPFDPFAG